MTVITFNGENNNSNLVLNSNSAAVNSNTGNSSEPYNAFMGSYPLNSLSGETIVIVHGAGTGATGLGEFAEELRKLGAIVYLPNYHNLSISGDVIVWPNFPNDFYSEGINNLVHFVNGTYPSGETKNNFIDLEYPSVPAPSNDVSLNNFILLAHSSGGIAATYLYRVLNNPKNISKNRIKRYINFAAAFPNVNGIIPSERQSYTDCNVGVSFSDYVFYDVVFNDQPVHLGAMPSDPLKTVTTSMIESIMGLQVYDNSFNFDNTDISYIFNDISTNLSWSEFKNKLTMILPEQDSHMGIDAAGVNQYYKQLNNYKITHTRVLKPPGGHLSLIINPKMIAEWIYYSIRSE
jgi:hypothetical protein